jgi:hypothetical protein
MLNLNTPEFVSFLKGLTEIVNADTAPGCEKELVVDVRTKFIVILTKYKDDGVSGQQSTYAFCAREDFESKTLGKVRAGDILKPASYKAPAKHARGNLFDPNPLDMCGKYGLEYLR